MFGMPAPRFGSISVIVDDVAAAARFLASLGVEFEPTLPEWAVHHRSFAADVSDFDADIDSPSFASWWGGVPSDGATRFVVNLSVDAREDVDRVHRQGLGAGAVELKAPFDAFWGARYAVMLAPGPLCVGVMSAPEPGRRTAPPPISAFATPTGTDSARA
jgi:catechol 2,3-dioxygenase-like lactoylglutathione lyase family enzyme